MSFPLPTVPNFKVVVSEPGHVKLIWADFPPELKAGHQLLGFRIYRSSNKDELGQLIADESLLNTNVFQFDDTDPQAGPNRYYVVVAVEQNGFGQSPFGQVPHGEPNSNGFDLLPFNTRPFGAPLLGFGQSPFDTQGYGF